ncbi:MAG: hypothetical protein MUQ00_04060 [Candidatus Aminicenantes bacterium]|nr:hypothetical protein [Candidatus Aminicenantes bacterium]
MVHILPLAEEKHEAVALTGELVERSLELDPDSARAWLLKGDIFDRLNWLEEAVEAFDKAVALGYKSSYPCGEKGWLLLDLSS